MTILNETTETTTETTTTETWEVDDADSVGIGSAVEQVLTEAAREVEARLIERRAMRDLLNAQIKSLVADQAIIGQALRPFTRKQNGDH